MPIKYARNNPVECWNVLSEILNVGHTKPFTHYPDKKQVYNLQYLKPCFQDSYFDNSETGEYLLDDIYHALFEEELPHIDLVLSGKQGGPITENYTFTFTKQGLVQYEYYYNDD